ncbi:phospholipase D/nuclease [Calocera viscosa TUFC12733]|uniref:Phospholipase D/nuclease n=1 Tax=Calocera viscosa (strain TUFC12733) TaxID=1330018 RepID=A0A167HX19_CALVF|nr:phospholipase D/nuclease [Calocera viscosa TUFC12733]
MDEDEEFQAAIAASLAEAERQRARAGPQRNTDIIDLTDDNSASDDEEAIFERELALALEASKQAASAIASVPSSVAPALSLPKASARAAPRAVSSSASPAVSPAPSQSGSSISSSSAQPAPAVQPGPMAGFLSDRAKLEQERLARQKRHLDERASRNGTKRPRTESPPPSSSSPASSPEVKRTALPSVAEKTVDPNHGYFWDGEIRQTGNAHVKIDPKRPRFNITDIVSPTSDLEFVLLSSYCTDTPWLTTFLPIDRPLLLVVDPDHDQRSHAGLKHLGIGDWLRVTPRIWQSRGVMHIKLMLLFHKSGRLRIVLPTANLVDYDWRDIENTVFVQDLPSIHDPSAEDPQSHDFPTYLWGVLKSLNVPAGLLNLVNTGYHSLPIQSLADLQNKWDWSKVKAKLVASVAGNYEGWYNVRMYGHPRLAAVIRDIGAPPKKGKQLNIECQGSSVGNYTTQYLNEVYKSCCGTDPISWIDTPKARLSKLPWPPVKILFPTLQTVDESVFGRNGGGSFFCRKMYWHKAGAPKQLFHNAKAKDGPVLMHTKMIVGTYRTGSLMMTRPTPLALPTNGKGKGKEKVEVIVLDSESDDESESDTEQEGSTTEDECGEGAERGPEAWIYVGSHNFTMAAWGSVSGSILAPKLNIANFEMGIVVPIKDKKELEKLVPWEQPPKRYGPNDVPWMQEEHRNQDEPTWRQLAATD